MLDSAMLLAIVDSILANVPEVPSEFSPPPPNNQALKSASIFCIMKPSSVHTIVTVQYYRTPK